MKTNLFIYCPADMAEWIIYRTLGLCVRHRQELAHPTTTIKPLISPPLGKYRAQVSVCFISRQVKTGRNGIEQDRTSARGLNTRVTNCSAQQLRNRTVRCFPTGTTASQRRCLPVVGSQTGQINSGSEKHAPEITDCNAQIQV